MTGDPASTTLTPENRRAGPWWQALGSPQLDAVMAEALQGNQTLAAALSTLDQARVETQRAQLAARSPRINTTATVSRNRINTSTFGFSGFPSPTINFFSVGGGIAYDMDVAGGGRRRMEAAGAAEAAQGFRTDAAYLSLTGNVALQAVKIAGAREQIDALKAIEADDQAIIDIARRAEAAGGSSPSAGTADRALLSQDQAQMPVLAQNLAQARHALALLVGKSSSQWTAPDFAFAQFAPPSAIPVAIPSDLVRHRPDILAAEADLHADTARIGVAKADFYPDVKLTANFTQMSISPSTFFNYGASGWNFGPSLSMPILGTRSRRVHMAVAETQARTSMARYRQTVLAAFAQVADVLTALSHDDETLAADDRYVRESQGGLRDAEANARLGGGTRLAEVEARRRVERARFNRVDTQARRLMDVVQLYAATSAVAWQGYGGGDGSHPAPVGGR